MLQIFNDQLIFMKIFSSAVLQMQCVRYNIVGLVRNSICMYLNGHHFHGSAMLVFSILSLCILRDIILLERYSDDIIHH